MRLSRLGMTGGSRFQGVWQEMQIEEVPYLRVAFGGLAVIS